MNASSPLLWLLPGAPAALALLLSVLPARRCRWRALAALAVGSELLLLVLALWAAAAQPTASWSWGPLLRLDLRVVGLARVMLPLVPLIGAPVALYAAASQREDDALPRQLALLVAFTGAMEVLVLADDLLTLLIGWELVGAFSWALIGFQWRDAERPRAALDAFITTRGGDLGLYLAAAATFAGTGSLHYEALTRLPAPAVHLVAAGILLAAAAKSAQLPFSPWLFRAMAGPTPASALLHSATMVAAGAYALARLTPLLGGAAWLGGAVVVVGAATALAGGVVAVVQRQLKRALAASTSAQYGLMFVAIGVGAPLAAGIHLVAHAAFKALLFMMAGVVLHVAGTLDLQEVSERALGRRLPRAAALFWVGALALAAVPPLGGAYSKEQLVAAAERGGPLLTTVVLAAGALGVLYALRLALLAFGPAGATSAPVERLPRPAELAGPFALAVVSLALGAWWIPSAARVSYALQSGRELAGSTAVLVASLALAVAAAGCAWGLHRRGRLLALALPAGVRTALESWFGLGTLGRRVVRAPVLALAGVLARADEGLVDRGLRAAVAAAALLSRLLAWGGERSLDALVTSAAAAAEGIARLSGRVDVSGVDGAVEGVARGIADAGTRSRRLQTGLVHQYYVLLLIGALIIVGIAALGGGR